MRCCRQTLLNIETAQNLKVSTISALGTAGSIAQNTTELNGDGKIGADDPKIAAQKAGVAWVSIGPDLKVALASVRGCPSVGVIVIPSGGQAIAIPSFIGTTAYSYLIGKPNNLKKK